MTYALAPFPYLNKSCRLGKQKFGMDPGGAQSALINLIAKTTWGDNSCLPEKQVQETATG